MYLWAFLSGIAALCYEVVWAKSFSLTLGGTRLAAGAVLTGFLGGMAVGARVYPVLLARVRRPLRLYALLEVGIALTALLLTLALPHLPRLFVPLSEDLGPGAVAVLRFVVATALLLVPCALMGATFPALGVAVIRSREGLGRRLGALYGFNTVGAAVGALLAGLVLVETFGLRGTVILGNVLNLAVASLALTAARGEQPAPRAGEVDEPVAPSTRVPRAVTGTVLLLSGFATLAYEIVWFRALTYLFGNSTHAFSMMLFVFLAGLGGGSLLLGPVSRIRSPERVLAVCQLLIALLSTAAIAAIAAILSAPETERQVSVFFDAAHGMRWWHRLLIGTGVTVGTLLPATLMMGLSFPLATSLFVGSTGRLGAGLGGAALLANAGSIGGALAAALLVLPAWGTSSGTLAIAAVNLALGLLLLSASPGRHFARAAAGTAAVIAFAVAASVVPPQVRFAVASRAVASPELLYEKEGDLATVQVWRDRRDHARMGMAIDGTIIGATQGWGDSPHRKQVFLAHLPLLLDARAQSVLTVGLGCGSTLEALIAHANVLSADVVEINAPVAEACRLFHEGSALDDPRVTLAVEDAIHYLQRADRRWDVIVSDGKQAMAFSGNAKLLTREYYELCLERMSGTGIFVQWMPLGIAAEEFRTIIRTLTSVFPHVDLFFEPPANLVLTASREPLAGRPRSLAGDASGTRVARDLAELDIAGTEAVLGRWVADGPALLAVVGPGGTNTWDRPRLEFTAYRNDAASLEAGTAAILALVVQSRTAAQSSPESALAATASGEGMALLRAAFASAAAGDESRARELAGQALARSPEDPALRRWSWALGNAPIG
ncbi:MAG: fused MFS/spermidine synthase [Candidatus Eiseniibacteriota bacterium]